jgi:hypothetical protein
MAATDAANAPNTTDAADRSATADHVVTALVQALLDGRSPRDRVRTVRLLQIGVTVIERQVLQDAKASGMTWAEIGDVYGITRQAAHRRFNEPTIMSPEGFDELLAYLDEPPEFIPALARAAERVRAAEAAEADGHDALPA